MKRIFIFLSMIYYVGAAVDMQSHLPLNDQIIISILSNSRNIEQLNENLSKIQALSPRIKTIIENNGKQIISSYLKNKFGNKFDIINFNIDNKETYADYIEPLILITKNLNLSSLNQLLMNIGIDTNFNTDYLYNNYNIITLIIRSKHNNESREKLIHLLKLGFANFIPKDGNTPLTHAITTKDIDLLKLLIKFDVDINRKLQENSYPALINAASLGYLDIVKLLVDSGANINDKFFGNDAIFYASKKGHSQVVDFLKAAKKTKKKSSEKKDTCSIM